MGTKRKSDSDVSATDDFLKPGSIVEISSNDHGFQGSWYIGTILKRSRASGSSSALRFLVQYTELFEDEAGTKPLKEYIDAVDLRPLAPRERSRKFKFGEEVDAYHHDGWWEGVITKELDNGNFHVYFKRSKEQLEFGEDQLRFHREWINGSWDPPLMEDEPEKVQKEEEVKSSKRTIKEKMLNNSGKKVTQGKKKSEEVITEPKLDRDNAAVNEQLKSDKTGNKEDLESGKITSKEKFIKGAQVEVTSDEDGYRGAWFAATIVKAVGKNKYLVQYESLRDDDDVDFLKEEFDAQHIRPHPPENVVANQFKKLDEVDALHNDGWWVGVISKVLPEAKYMVYFKTSNEEIMFKHSQLRRHQDYFDGKWWVAAPEVLNS